MTQYYPRTEKAVRRYCSRCDAKPGEPCKTATGAEMANIVHSSRGRTLGSTRVTASDIAKRMSDPGNSGP